MTVASLPLLGIPGLGSPPSALRLDLCLADYLRKCHRPALLAITVPANPEDADQPWVYQRPIPFEWVEL